MAVRKRFLIYRITVLNSDGVILYDTKTVECVSLLSLLLAQSNATFTVALATRKPECKYVVNINNRQYLSIQNLNIILILKMIMNESQMGV